MIQPLKTYHDVVEFMELYDVDVRRIYKTAYYMAKIVDGYGKGKQLTPEQRADRKQMALSRVGEVLEEKIKYELGRYKCN